MSSETGFWNFRFKLILLIALLMAGTLSVQAVIRNHSIQVILDGTEEVAAEIANEAAEKMLMLRLAAASAQPAAAAGARGSTASHRGHIATISRRSISAWARTGRAARKRPSRHGTSDGPKKKFPRNSL